AAFRCRVRHPADPVRGAYRPLELPIAADAVAHALGRLAVPGLLHAVAYRGERAARQQLRRARRGRNAPGPVESSPGRWPGQHRSPAYLQCRVGPRAAEHGWPARHEGRVPRRMGNRHHFPGLVRAGADGLHRLARNGRNGPSGTGYDANQRPNMAVDGDCRADNPANKEQILDLAACQRVVCELGAMGNEKRGKCRGPGFVQTDLALYKTIRAGSKLQVQARFEIFNVFNTTNFLSQNLHTSLNASSYTLDPTQTTITSFTPAGNFGQATRVRDARQAQFGFKVIFSYSARRSSH